MKPACLHFLLLAATALPLRAAETGRRLTVEIEPRFQGAPLVFDVRTNTTAAGQSVSVTRLDFLLSRFAFRQTNGVWVEARDQFAFISAREGRTSFRLNEIPSGPCDRLRFDVGLTPDVNHSDAAAYPAGHPLNPLVNGLHWGWMGGYVFLALEGGWLKPDGQLGGYSYHLATDRSLAPVELPVDFSGGPLHLALNVEKILGGEITDATASTHSRTNDVLAAQLVDNVTRAFTVESGRAAVLPGQPVRASAPLIASKATPYRLAISRFFPVPALPADNPLTEQGVELGRRLFVDTKLSVNGSQSCAGCHAPERAFTDGRKTSLGAEGKPGIRNAPALFNLAWKSSFFWDGRAATLREQVLQPIVNPMEMHETLPGVIAKLRKADYGPLFERAFGSPEISADRIARALEQFLLAQVSFDSKFDRVLNRADQFTEEEQRGFELFHTEYDPRHGRFGADCFHCHGGPLLQSQNFANNGLDTAFPDAGRSAVTAREGDVGKFAVPSLRNVELTAPYMHDGRLASLEEAVEHYCTGVKRSATLDPNLAKHPDGGVPLSDSDKKALVVFLKTLTSERLRAAHDSAVSTTSPEARRSEQTKNKEETKGNKI